MCYPLEAISLPAKGHCEAVPSLPQISINICPLSPGLGQRHAGLGVSGRLLYPISVLHGVSRSQALASRAILHYFISFFFFFFYFFFSFLLTF